MDDDPGTRSPFLPRIAANPPSGNTAVGWQDARNAAGDDRAQAFCPPGQGG